MYWMVDIMTMYMSIWDFSVSMECRQVDEDDFINSQGLKENNLIENINNSVSMALREEFK